MSEYIEKQAVMNKFAEVVAPSNNSDFARVPSWNDAVEIIEGFPPADVRPVVRGKWIDYDDDYGAYCCSVCEHDAPEDTKWPYCPNCMADMREGKP